MHSYGLNFDTTQTSLPHVLPHTFFTQLSPEPVPSPKTVIVNHALATDLGLDFSLMSHEAQAELFSGNQLPKGATPFSQAYAGHQFGYFTMLGDGRAHIWGEHITPTGARYDLQFKGSGRTPYSRNGDGKAALAPMLREYLISEAIHHLGIPTTRSLAVVTTGEKVIRDAILQGAILTRVASSHLRVGTFEYAARLPDKTAINALLDYSCKRHYPELLTHQNKALALIEAVMERQAELIVNWMRVGFIHGVMNTDNMTLSGQTIDYGPCAFMDHYHPKTVFSSIDHGGRYAYANQPYIAQWNLARFAETLIPLIDSDENKALKLAEQAIESFSDLYYQKWLSMMRSKLGLFGMEEGDEKLITDLLNWMQENEADYTNSFRDLSQKTMPTNALYQQSTFKNWYKRWQDRLEKDGKLSAASLKLMKQVNPAIIPRNHIVEQALEAANEGDFQPFMDLVKILQTPYQDRNSLKPYQTPPQPSERIYETFCGT